MTKSLHGQTNRDSTALISQVVAMGKIDTVRGVMKTLFWLTKDEWSGMDHKLFRMIFGVIGFVVMALFWFYFIRTILPSPFL